MSLLVSDCPRCGSKSMTFDVKAQVYRDTYYKWQNWYEIFSVCRNCSRPTIFIVALSDINERDKFYKADGLIKYEQALNQFFEIKRYVSIRDNVTLAPPEHLPNEIENAFTEGAACSSTGCYNAAACMYRLCVDLATRPLLPDANNGTEGRPNSKQRRDLGLRLAWLFDNGILPASLRELAKCIREDANDGAHVGSLSKEDDEDLADFTIALLERLITEPMTLQLAEERRAKRRSKK